ncbi:MAG: aminoglycoside phosphotransferase family protein [Patescibacteria group bacterium]
MNKIYNLLDEQLVADLFRKKVLPLYPAFRSIEKITINPIKKNIWNKAYHVVFEYETIFKKNSGETVKLLIYTSAHSAEPRKNVFTALSFLWDSSFSDGNFTIPRPLFFESEYNAVFYRGVRGKNLYYYIQSKNFAEIESLVKKTALWLAKLHRLPAGAAQNFNEINSRVETIIPGRKETLNLIRDRYPDQLASVAKCYEAIIGREEKHLDETKARCLIHGDAHSENVIRVSEEKIAMIDFTDICLGDFARDLGAFIQQLEYKCRKKFEDGGYIEKLKKIFLDAYLHETNLKLTPDLAERIKTYYYWTSFRTAIFLFLFHNPQPQKAKELLAKTMAGLDIN